MTGADSGIGRAIAVAFAREGANVALSYWKEDKDAQETKQVVEESGQEALLLPGDLTQEAQCKWVLIFPHDSSIHCERLLNQVLSHQILSHQVCMNSCWFRRVQSYCTCFATRAYHGELGAQGSICDCCSLHDVPTIVVTFAYTCWTHLLCGNDEVLLSCTLLLVVTWSCQYCMMLTSFSQSAARLSSDSCQCSISMHVYYTVNSPAKPSEACCFG